MTLKDKIMWYDRSCSFPNGDLKVVDVKKAVEEFVKELKEVRDDLWLKWKNNQITFTELDRIWYESIDKLNKEKFGFEESEK